MDISGEMDDFLVIIIDNLVMGALSDVQGSFLVTLSTRNHIIFIPKCLERAIPAEGRPVFFCQKKHPIQRWDLDL